MLKLPPQVMTPLGDFNPVFWIAGSLVIWLAFRDKRALVGVLILLCWGFVLHGIPDTAYKAGVEEFSKDVMGPVGMTVITLLVVGKIYDE